MLNIAVCSTKKVHPLSVEGRCGSCGKKIFYVPTAFKKDRMCASCVLTNLEMTGAMAHTIREGKIIETYKDPGIEQMVKALRRVIEKEMQ